MSNSVGSGSETSDSGTSGSETTAPSLWRSSRFVVFVVLGVVLLGLALSGVFTASSDADLSEAEAIEIARPLIDFEPVNEGARFLRQGAGLRPVWAVSFSIPGSGTVRDDFERLTTVQLDARSGEVLRVIVDEE